MFDSSLRTIQERNPGAKNTGSVESDDKAAIRSKRLVMLPRLLLLLLLLLLLFLHDPNEKERTKGCDERRKESGSLVWPRRQQRVSCVFVWLLFC